jgi:hypothetical protein
MRSYALIGCGTFGKTVARQVARVRAFYERPPIPAAVFDSDTGHFLPASLLPAREDAQIDVSLDGNDLRQALARGEYPRLAALDREQLKHTKMRGGFSLYPPLGAAAATVHRRTLRDVLRGLCQLASDIRTAQSGELVAIRCFSSLGGTARGLVWEIGEALLDISRETGLKIHLLDLVAIPGLGTSTSQFNRHYLTNTLAFVKEAAALRADAFHRIVWNERGEAAEARSTVLPSTLVLVSDTGAEGQTLPLELQAAGLARFVDLLTLPAFSDAFWGTYADLVRHGTVEPYAARLGLYSVFVPSREETIARRYQALGRSVELMLREGEDAPALGQGLLERLGLWASSNTTLRLLDRVRERLVERLGHDPLKSFRSLFALPPAEYFDEYRRRVEALRGVDVEALARELAEELEKSGVFEDEIARLRTSLLPGTLLAVLKHAAARLERDREELARDLESVADARVQDEEQAASAAHEAYRSLRARRWALPGSRRAGLEDARNEVQAHLGAALGQRVEFLLLRAFASIAERILADIRGGAIPAWETTRRDTEAFIAALAALREEIASLEQLARSGAWAHRGPATPVGRLAAPTAATGGPDPAAIVDSVRAMIPGLYGASSEAMRREMLEGLWGAVCHAIPWAPGTLGPESLDYGVLREVASKAAPLSPVDATLARGLRARFVVARGGDASPVRRLAAAAFPGSNPADRERWIDASAEHADELVVVTFEEGVPLRAFKGLRQASETYRANAGREHAHLEPLYALLPDPVAPVVSEEEFLALGLLARALDRHGDDLVHVDEDGTRRRVDALSYETVASVASRFIARVRREGFAPVLAEATRLAAEAEGTVAQRVADALRRWADIYHQPVAAERRQG